MKLMILSLSFKSARIKNAEKMLIYEFVPMNFCTHFPNKWKNFDLVTLEDIHESKIKLHWTQIFTKH